MVDRIVLEAKLKPSREELIVGFIAGAISTFVGGWALSWYLGKPYWTSVLVLFCLQSVLRTTNEMSCAAAVRTVIKVAVKP